MKKLKKLIFPILLVGIIFTGVYVKADSGFDSDYSSSDYSSYDSSDYSSSDYSSYDSDYEGSSDDFEVIFGFLVILFIIFGFIYTNFIEKKKGNSNVALQKDESKIDEIKKLIPDFDKDVFKQETFGIYKEIQDAWMNFDYDILRKNTTDEMFNMYSSQLDTLKVKGQKNIMKDYKLNDFYITNIDITKDDISITAYMQISLYDYIVDKDGKYIKGYNNKKTTINYEMTFVRTISEKENVCPNCHAKLSNSASTKCEYCGSIITPKSHDFVLSKKINKGQY